MTGVYRHYPPPRLRPPSAVFSAQPPPVLPLQLLERSPQLHLREGDRARPPLSTVTAPTASAPPAQFPMELLQAWEGLQVHVRADARGRARVLHYAALDDLVDVVGGDAHPPPAIHHREPPRRFPNPHTRIFTGQAAAPPAYLPPQRELRPVSIEPNRARFTSAPIAALLTEPPAAPAFPAELFSDVRMVYRTERDALSFEPRTRILPAEPSQHPPPAPRLLVRGEDTRSAPIVRSLAVPQTPATEHIPPTARQAHVRLEMAWPRPATAIAAFLTPPPVFTGEVVSVRLTTSAGERTLAVIHDSRRLSLLDEDGKRLDGRRD